MAKDRNDPQYPLIEDPDKALSDSEGHMEPPDDSMKTNVVDYEHPYFTSNGMIQMINFARKFANTKEKELSGEIPYQVFLDIADAARKTKVPYDLLVFACDWMQAMTARSGASDATGIAQKMISFVPELRSSLGRDPMFGEVFAAFATGSASKVKQMLDDAINKPEEEAQPPGTQKDDIVINKTRAKKTQKRTNRELYDFFYRRMSQCGKILFKRELGKDKYAPGQ